MVNHSEEDKPCATGIMRMASVRSSETVGKMKMDIKIDIDREKENIKMEKRNGQQTSRAGQV